MCDHTNTSKVPSLSLEISLQGLDTLACKPSKVKDTDNWFCKPNKTENSAGLPTQNTDTSIIEPVLESRIKEMKVNSSPNDDKETLEERMGAERKVLLEAFDNQMVKKMEEMDNRISKRWEDAVTKMHEQYGQKIEKYGEVLKDIQTKKDQNSQQEKMKLEKQITDKYRQEYLDKLEAVKKEFRNISSEKIVDILSEVRTQLEIDCQEKYELQISNMQGEIKQETEQIKNEQSQELCKTDFEKRVKAEYEAVLSDLAMENQRTMTALRKDMRDLEQGRTYQRIKADILEEMGREYIVKEDEMNRCLKEKLAASKRENDEVFEQKRFRRLSQDNVNITTEKKEVAVMDNSRVKRAEEFNKELERKFAEKEELYMKAVEELNKELDELKASRNIPNSARPSVRNTSTEREPRRSAHQRNSSKSTDRLRRSCDFSGTDVLGIKGSSPESGSKICNTARSRRESLGSEKKTTNKSGDKKTANLTKSPVKQPNFNQYFQPFSTERTAKALLQMLSPGASSDMYYIRGDARVESMQDPISEATKIVEELNKLKEAENHIKVQQAAVTPQKSHYQRSCSNLMDLRGRAIVNAQKEKTPNRFEDTLKQKNSNLHCRRASMTERKLELKGSETERSRNVDRIHTNRYEELLTRQTSAAKIRGGSISNKKENMSGYVERSGKKQGPVRGSFQNQENLLSERKSYTKGTPKNIFEIRDNDDEETKRMKKLKKIVEDRFNENDLLASKCQKKEVDLCLNFPWRTSIDSVEQEKALQDKLKTLFELWKAVQMSSVTKLAFMEDLERLIRYEDIVDKISDEINFIAQLATETEAITKLLTWRGQLRDQIKVSDQSQELYEKIYAALEKNNRELREALEYYQNENGKLVQFKGVDLREIIQVDSWESEYLKNTKPQLSTPQKAL